MKSFENILIMLSFLLILWTGCREQLSPVEQQNQKKHLLYQHYDFSNNKKVIELGASIPSSTVTHLIEVMKRDEILKEELARSGYAVKFYFFQKGSDMASFITNHSLEGVFAGDMPTLMMASTGNITVFSLFSRVNVALASREIYRVKDLQNKRVAFPYGSNAHYYLLKLLKEKGLSISDIKQVPMDNRDMLDAVKQKKIDAFAAFEPTVTIYTRLDPTLHVINRSFSSYNFFSMRKNYAADNPRAVKAILAAQFRAMAWLRLSDRNLNRASRWVAEDTEKFIPLPMDKHIADLNAICDENLMTNMMDYHNLTAQSVLGDNGDMRKEFEFLKMQGIIPLHSDWQDIIRHFDTQTAQNILRDRKLLEPRIQ